MKKELLKIVSTCAAVILISHNANATQDCSFSFSYKAENGESSNYPIENIREFVVNEIRPSISKNEARNIIYAKRKCQAMPDETVKIEVQSDDYYITNVKGTEVGEDVYRYDDKNMRIDKNTFSYYFEKSKSFDTLSKTEQSNVLKMFAYVFAESARFEETEKRLDDIFKNGCSVNWNESRTAFRRWAVLSKYSAENKINDHKYSGGKNGNLFSPIRSAVVEAYNRDTHSTDKDRISDLIKKGAFNPNDTGRPIGFDAPICGQKFISIPAQEERDEILMLLAYSIVLNDWQDDVATPRRGHNIGSVLANADGVPIFWSRNANKISDDATQHGEVRLVQNYLNCKDIGAYMTGLTVYTTLEPCAMCSGMMTLTQVSRVVYGQTDPAFGGAARALTSSNYPKVYDDISLDSSKIKQALDKKYAEYLSDEKNKPSITSFLLSEKAKNIYNEASRALNNYKVNYPENQPVLDAARKMKEGAYKEDAALGLKANCPK